MSDGDEDLQKQQIYAASSFNWGGLFMVEDSLTILDYPPQIHVE